jgi:hypothetical protein
MPRTTLSAPAYSATAADKSSLKILVSTLYLLQKQRIAMANRVAAHVRVQLGQEPGMPTSEISPEAQKTLTQMKAEYGKLSTAIAKTDPRSLRGLLDEHRGVIASPYAYYMTENYMALEEMEGRLSHEIAALVKEFPIWAWLETVKGVGPVLAAILISELDPHRARRPSSFWAAAGLDVVPVYAQPILAGSRAIGDDGHVLLRGAGRGFAENGDQFYHLWAYSGAATVLAATVLMPSAGPCGLVLRAGQEDAHAAFYALVVEPSGRLAAQWRAGPGCAVEEQSLGMVALPLRLEVESDGLLCQARLYPAEAPAQTKQDMPLAGRRVSLGDVVQAGPFVAGSEGLAADAQFADVVLTPDLDEPLAPQGGGWFGSDVGDVAGYQYGQGRSKRREHLVKRTYKARDGTIKERDSITYNPFLKTKLMGVLGPSFLKAGGHYRDIYYEYKNRYEHHERYGLAAQERKEDGATQAHRHMMAMRVAVKRFLCDLWTEWRQVEGLPVYPTYYEAKLRRTHGA